VWRVWLIIALVLGFLVGGLLLLRSTAKTRVPPELLERMRRKKKGSDIFSADEEDGGK
jgi:F0F1-type ATP synthase assembly protein I